jgi:glycosyltransferase involved in cell wall biosynthesis
MKILNVMLSKGLGGIEQVFLDYNHALNLHHNHVIPVIHPKSPLKHKIYGHFETLFNLNKFDLIAIYRLKKLIKREKPKCIITHGNRATSLVRLATDSVPIVAVAHNYKFKPLLKADAIITITKDIRKTIINAGKAKDNVYHVPNFIQMPECIEYIKPNFKKPIVLGFMGRFVKKKGLDVLLSACDVLKKKGIDFKLKIAGDGEEKASVEKMVIDFNLGDRVEFLGWVTNKEEFYRSLDIFCLPSYHEPFGLVLLEAFMFCVPVVATKSEGPSEIGTDEKNLLFCQTGDYLKFASNIEKLSNDEKLAEQLAIEGYDRVQNYTSWSVARKLQVVLEEVIFKKLQMQN